MTVGILQESIYRPVEDAHRQLDVYDNAFTLKKQVEHYCCMSSLLIVLVFV